MFIIEERDFNDFIFAKFLVKRNVTVLKKNHILKLSQVDMNW